MRSVVVASVAFFVVLGAGCPVSVDVPPPPDAGPQGPDGGPVGGEGEGEGEGGVEGEGEGAEGEGEGIVISEGEGEGEGEGGIVITEGEGEGGEGEGEGEGEGPLPPGVRAFTVDVDGTTRTVQMVVPPTVRGPPLPLIIALHGNGDDVDGASFLQELNLLGVANNEDVIFAVPDGLTREVRLNGLLIGTVAWDPYNNAGDNIDLAFLDELIARLTATGEVDVDAVHVFGFSQGGYMAFRYALENAADIASAVVVSAGNPFNDDRLITAAARRVPVALRVSSSDASLAVAEEARDKLTTGGHEVVFTVVNGADAVFFPLAPGETAQQVVTALVEFQRARPLP